MQQPLRYGNNIPVSASSIIVLYTICSVISIQLASSREIVVSKRKNEDVATGERQSHGETNIFMDGGYGSRIQTGARLAKWKQLSDYVYGPLGPGRKRRDSFVKPSRKPRIDRMGYIMSPTIAKDLQTHISIICRYLPGISFFGNDQFTSRAHLHNKSAQGSHQWNNTSFESLTESLNVICQHLRRRQ